MPVGGQISAQDKEGLSATDHGGPESTRCGCSVAESLPSRDGYLLKGLGESPQPLNVLGCAWGGRH